VKNRGCVSCPKPWSRLPPSLMNVCLVFSSLRDASRRQNYQMLRCIGLREWDLRKWDGTLLCEAPFGPFRQKGPVPFSQTIFAKRDLDSGRSKTKKRGRNLQLRDRMHCAALPPPTQKALTAKMQKAPRKTAVSLAQS
jgi:hypothetical protein